MRPQYVARCTRGVLLTCRVSCSQGCWLRPVGQLCFVLHCHMLLHCDRLLHYYMLLGCKQRSTPHLQSHQRHKPDHNGRLPPAADQTDDIRGHQRSSKQCPDCQIRDAGSSHEKWLASHQEQCQDSLQLHASGTASPCELQSPGGFLLIDGCNAVNATFFGGHG